MHLKRLNEDGYLKELVAGIKTPEDFKAAKDKILEDTLRSVFVEDLDFAVNLRKIIGDERFDPALRKQAAGIFKRLVTLYPDFDSERSRPKPSPQIISQDLTL